MRTRYTIEGMRTTLDNNRKGWGAPHDEWIGDLYGGLFHILPPLCWWAFGNGTLALIMFVMISTLTLWATWRLAYRIFIILRWGLRKITRRRTTEIKWLGVTA